MSIPVVLLPGIMGSRLFWEDRSGRAWDPDDTPSMLRWAVLGSRGDQLAKIMDAQVPVRVMKVSPGVDADESRRGWAGVVQAYYRPLLNRLNATDRPTYAIGYDWRRSLLATAEVAYKQLQVLGLVGEFDLVTHSMGGLLSRVMLAKFPELEKRVRRVVHICQPCLGAPVMYRRMFTGGDVNIDGNNFINRVFFRILGNSGPKFRTNVCGMPGALQLLPADNYRYRNRIIGGLDAPLLPVYLGAVHPPGLCPAGTTSYVALRMAASLNEFAKFSAAIQNCYYPNAWYIVGGSLDTDVQVDIAKDKVDAVRHSEGDGTVPVASAFHPDLQPQLLADMLANVSEHRVGIADVEHVAAPSDASVINATMQLLQH